MIKFDVKGKSWQELAEIDITDFNMLTRSQLSKVVSRLASTANKRFSRLSTQEKGYSPAYKSAEKSGGRFSVKGKNINELRSEFVRVRNFLTSKTSTIKGIEEVESAFLDRIGADYITDNDRDKLWSVYNRLSEIGGIDVVNYDSGDRQKIIYDVIRDNPSKNINELLEIVKIATGIEYEEKQRFEYDEFADAFTY